jgi:hypothetical protein
MTTQITEIELLIKYIFINLKIDFHFDKKSKKDKKINEYEN